MKVRRVFHQMAFAAISTTVLGTALAASNVQIYGVVDIGVTKGNGGTSVNPGALGTNDQWQLKQASASRLGFRGTEDLGGGWSAGFLLEQRFNLNDGGKNPNSPLFMQSTVSLSQKDIGTLWMGRDYIPAFWVALKADPFGMDGVGQMGLGGLMAGFMSTTEVANRTNNTVGFKSARWNGLSADFAYAMSQDQGPAQSGLNLQYQNGPWYAGFGFAKKNKAVQPSQANNDELLNLAVIYSFDKFRLMGYLAEGKNKNFDLKTRVYSVGADAQVGDGRVKLGYYYIDANQQGDNRRKLGLGYDYNLSKRTRLYLDFGVAHQKDKSSNTAFGTGIRVAF